VPTVLVTWLLCCRTHHCLVRGRCVVLSTRGGVHTAILKTAVPKTVIPKDHRDTGQPAEGRHVSPLTLLDVGITVFGVAVFGITGAPNKGGLETLSCWL